MLAIALVVTFIAIRALPGDPIIVMLGDRSSDVEFAHSLRVAYGLDRPLWVQFLAYVGDLFRGDFGMSFQRLHTPVWDIIAGGLLISPLLAFAALALALPVGTFVGAFAAVRRNSWADSSVMLLLVLGLSLPNFALAAFFVYVFSIKLALLPVAGWGSIGQAVLPVVVLAIPSAAYIARLSRTFMLEVMQQDYIRTARAKGLREGAVIYRHALRNILIPILTSAGITFGGIMTQAFVVEIVFNIPGLGRMAVESVFARDYPVTMAIVLLFTLSFVLINFIVDILYVMIDPRVRTRLTSK